MSKYIDRKDALRILSDVLLETDPDSEEQLAVLKCSRLIEKLPAVDGIPVEIKPRDTRTIVVMI
nr:MAG TPA: hypothetical protein [Caudoviricetes sp.]